MVDLPILDADAIFTAIGIAVVSALVYFVKKGAIGEIVSPKKNTIDTTLEDRLCKQMDELKTRYHELKESLGKHLSESTIDHLVLMSLYKKTFPEDPLNLFDGRKSPI